jgi:hypothetical protein
MIGFPDVVYQLSAAVCGSAFLVISSDVSRSDQEYMAVSALESYDRENLLLFVAGFDRLWIAGQRYGSTEWTVHGYHRELDLRP